MKKALLINTNYLAMAGIIICISEPLLLIEEAETHDVIYELKVTQSQAPFGMTTQNIVKQILFKVADVLEKLEMILSLSLQNV